MSNDDPMRLGGPGYFGSGASLGRPSGDLGTSLKAEAEAARARMVARKAEVAEKRESPGALVPGYGSFEEASEAMRREEEWRRRLAEATEPLLRRLAQLEANDAGFSEMMQAGGEGDGDHPFRVIDASDTEGLKVRVLPGLCNFAWATVGGVANDITDPEGHLSGAPRIDIPGTGYVALVFAGTTPGSPYPASVDIQYVSSMGTGTLPLAKITVSGGRITQIYQTVFDVVGVAALNYGGADDPLFMLTR